MTRARSTIWSQYPWLFEFGPLPVFLVLILVELLGPGFSATYAAWPFLISMVLVGLPHGAIDFTLSSRLHGKGNFQGHVTTVACYLLIMATLILLAVTAPLAFLILFAVISFWHFGHADTHELKTTSTERGLSPIVNAVATLGKGLLILGIPMGVQPAATADVVQRFLFILGSTDVPSVTAIASIGSVALIAALSILAILLVARPMARGKKRGHYEFLQLTVIAASLLLFHPLFAIGIYFLLWHSWRHMGRLRQVMFDASTTRGVFSDLVTLHVRALPLLLPTWLAYIGLAAWRLESWNAFDAAVLTLVIFAVVTLPHHRLVAQGIPWNPAPADVLYRPQTPAATVRVPSLEKGVSS